MRQGRDSLHLNGIPLLEGMIQNSRGVNDLPPQVSIIAMSHKERFSRERIRLHVDIGTGDLIHKTRFSHIGKTAHEQSAGVGVQGWKTGHVFAHFFEVGQTGLLAFEDGTHASQGGAFEAFAAIKGVAVFDHSDHVAGDGVDEGAGRVDLAQGEFVVILVVEGVA